MLPLALAMGVVNIAWKNRAYGVSCVDQSEAFGQSKDTHMVLMWHPDMLQSYTSYCQDTSVWIM